MQIQEVRYRSEKAGAAVFGMKEDVCPSALADVLRWRWMAVQRVRGHGSTWVALRLLNPSQSKGLKSLSRFSDSSSSEKKSSSSMSSSS